MVLSTCDLGRSVSEEGQCSRTKRPGACKTGKSVVEKDATGIVRGWLQGRRESTLQVRRGLCRAWLWYFLFGRSEVTCRLIFQLIPFSLLPCSRQLLDIQITLIRQSAFQQYCPTWTYSSFSYKDLQEQTKTMVSLKPHEICHFYHMPFFIVLVQRSQSPSAKENGEWYRPLQ